MRQPDDNGFSSLTDRPADPVRHGGDLTFARQRFPQAPLPWLDLSTGINPVPYPVGRLPPEAWQRLPDPAALAMLEATAALVYGARPALRVVAAPGTQALIALLPRLLPARSVAVLGFGYEEHPACWRAAGAEVAVVPTLDACAQADVVVVVNPNNPDGRMVDAEMLAGFARGCARRGATLVIDEAFMDVAEPAESLVPIQPDSGAIVLRSFGKAFGLAGLRLGFAIVGQDLGRRIAAALGPWAVSGPALAIGTQALADRDWQRDSRARLRADAARLDDMLAGAGFRVMGGTSLFRLTSRDDAGRWFERLGHAGILVRSFPARPTWLRFGLPGEASAWERLAEALRA